jgi:RNA polymerase sigma factor (sigma-70 family)
LLRRGVPSRDVDDVLQLVTLRVWQKWPQIQAARSPSAYMYRLACNEARAYLRRARHKREVFIDREEQYPCDEHQSPEDRSIRENHASIVRKCVDALDHRGRAVFVEHELDGKSVATIAAARGISSKTVETWLTHARRDFERAVARWLPERRAKGGKLFGLATLFWVAELRQLLRKLRRIDLRTVAPAGPVVLSGAILAATPIDPVAPPAFRPALHLSSAGSFTPARFGSATGPAQTPGEDDPGETLPAGVARAGYPKAHLTILETEEHFVDAARAALRLGTADARLRARDFLLEHRERFPEGRLAAVRELLWRQLQRARDVSTPSESLSGSETEGER